MDERPPADGEARAAGGDERVLGALALVVLFWCAARFGGLAATPHGNWLDETLGAIHVRCLAETGRTDGLAWPLFPRAHGGGVFGPTYIYFALLWTRLFGDSIASLRGIAALANVMTIAGLAVAGLKLGGRRLAVTAALAAALSPWSFQFSRIAWDPPLGPMFLVWGTVLFLVARSGPALVAAGLALALAAYSYPPTRLQAGLWLPLVVALQWRRGRVDLRGALLVLGAAAVAVVPIVVLLGEGAINARIHELTIFSPPWREWSRGLRGDTPEPLFLLFTFLDNVAAHLSPSFLFLRGDANLRHSTGASGVLGAIDVLAIVLLAMVAIRRLRGEGSTSTPVARPGDAPLALVLAAGALLGIAPAALCWEGIPHSLRAIGAWPFTSLLSALVLTRLWRRHAWVGPLLVAVSLAWSAFFLSYYFGPYRRIDPRWFHPDLMAAIEAAPGRPARESLRPFVGRPGYEREELQFYLMEHDRLGCDAAERVAREIWTQSGGR